MVAPWADEAPEQDDGQTAIDKKQRRKGRMDFPDQCRAEKKHHDGGSIVQDNQPRRNDSLTDCGNPAIGRILLRTFSHRPQFRTHAPHSCNKQASISRYRIPIWAIKTQTGAGHQGEIRITAGEGGVNEGQGFGDGVYYPGTCGADKEDPLSPYWDRQKGRSPRYRAHAFKGWMSRKGGGISERHGLQGIHSIRGCAVFTLIPDEIPVRSIRIQSKLDRADRSSLYVLKTVSSFVMMSGSEIFFVRLRSLICPPPLAIEL